MINRQLFRAARREPGGSKVALLGVGAGLTYLPQVWALAHGLSAIVSAAWAAAAAWALAIAVIATLRWGLSVAAASVAAQHGLAVRKTLRDRAFQTSLTPTETPVRLGAARGAIVDGADGVEVYVSKYLGALAQVALLCPLTLVLLAMVSPVAALACAAGLLGALCVPLWWRKQAARRADSHWDDYESFSADFAEYHRGMVTVRVLGAVGAVRDRMEVRSSALHRATVSTMRFSLADTAIADLAIQGATVAAAAVAAAHAVSGEPAPAVYLALLLAGETFRPVRELSRQWHAGYLGLSAVAGLAAFGAFDSSSVDEAISSGEGKSAGEGQPAADAQPAPVGGVGRHTEVGDLVLSGVSFAYGTTSILEGASIRVRPGQLVAVTGESGVGKSTLFDLVAGVLAPGSGTITLGNRGIRSEDVAVVSQRPVFTSGTIRDNLLAVAPRANDSEILSACSAAGFGDLPEILSGGLDAEFGEGGASVSGGQRQRLAVARAILSGRAVVLVDEPTSALDEHAADQVLSTLAEMATDRMVLVITHDPRVRDAAGCRLVVADGGINEVGAVRR